MTPNWIEYTVVKAIGVDKFEFEVNRHIRLGYLPQGGVISPSENEFAQAMTIDRETALTR